MKTNVRLAQKRALLRVKFHGTPIRIEWTEWLTAPLVDETSGATPSTPGVQRIVETKAMIHTIRVGTGFRLFGKLQVGDKIIDLLAPLKRITNPGQTTLLLGAVVDMFTLLKANRGIDPLLKATGEDVDTDSLKSAVVVIDGEKWSQQDVEEELKKVWDATFAGVKISQSLHLRRIA